MENRKNYLRIGTYLSIIMLAIFIYFGLNDVNINAAVSTSTVVSATGQAINDGTKLFPACKQVNGDIKYGYIDEKGSFKIKPIYQAADDFSDGVAIVNDGDENKVIDVNGNVLFKSTGIISNFHNGMAVFTDLNHNFAEGYINTKGKVVIKPQYRIAGYFTDNGTALVFSKTGKYLLINKMGKVLKTYKAATKYNDFNSFEDGYIIYRDQKTFFYGVVDLKGKAIFKPVYGEITYLGNNLFGIKKKPTFLNLGLLQKMPAAIFNKDGKQLTKYSLYDLSRFTGKYASYTDNTSTYFIDQNGKSDNTLPKLQGRGTMIMQGDIIKADNDGELIYMKKDGTIIWKYDSSYTFTSGISVRAYKFKPNKYAVVYYPVVQGLSDISIQQSIDSELKTIFTQNRKKLKEKDDLSVNDSFTAEQRNDLLIIRRNGYDYYFGGAHGTPIREYYFIDLKSGSFYTLQDLFKNNSGYVSKLSNIIKKQMKDKMKKGEMSYFPNSFKTINQNQRFYLKDDRLIIYFDVYEVTAYAAGFPEFEIPFKDIKDMINTEGTFWKAFQGE